jgi:N-acetylglutamate synthase-like GNAT family acetyltransferase
MRIVFLADFPHHVPTVAAWVYHQWLQQESGRSLARVEAQFSTHLQRDAIPLTLLALAEDQTLLGTASLYPQDMSTRPELSPWLAAVYVVPAYRTQGIGTQLVQASERVAGELGVPRLYLFTPDRMTFYARLGWEVLEPDVYRNEPVTIMTKRVGSVEKI